MTMRLKKTISVIGVPFDFGAGQRGADLGPGAIRRAGVIQKLEQLGYAVCDEGDVMIPKSGRPLTAITNLRHLHEVAGINIALCRKIRGVLGAGYFPLVLGGDHSIAIGTLAGIHSLGELGVIWFDAHSDVNTAKTSPSGNIHGMALAVALGYGHPMLTGIAGKGAKVKAEHTVIVGARSVDSGEKKFLKKLGVNVFTIRDIDRLGISEVMKRALDIAANGTKGIHLSFDLDSLDPCDAPGVGTPVIGGISLREGFLAMELISDADVLVSAEFVEVNPTIDIRNQTVQATVEMIGLLFGERII